jgi:hypothetical protein
MPAPFESGKEFNLSNYVAFLVKITICLFMWVMV